MAISLTRSSTAYPWLTEPRLRRLLLHSEVDAASRSAMCSADFEAMAAEQPANRTSGRRICPRPGIPIRDLRPHAFSAGRPPRETCLYVNSGTWTEFPPCPFVAVKGDAVRLEYWPPDRDGSVPASRDEHMAPELLEGPIGLPVHSTRAETS